ncbi:MAG: CotH kinase family protein, partial [Bacteroidota bacterium]
EQAQYIQDWIGTFEDALFSPDYTNSDGIRYDEYINLNSFTDFIIINELSKNADGYKLSSYLHKDRDSNGGKLVAGPIWDFDQSYGISLVCSNDIPTGWTYLQNQDGCEDLESMPLWWQEMMEDPLFQNHLKCRWENFRTSFLHQDSIIQWIESDTALISNAIARNFTVWDDFIGEEIWYEPDPVPETYAEEISSLQSWIIDRLNWMDANLPGTCTAVRIEEQFNAGDNVKIFPNPTREMLYIQAERFVSVDLIGSDGRILLRSPLKEIDLSHIDTGAYFVRIDTGIGQVTKKLIKY